MRPDTLVVEGADLLDTIYTLETEDKPITWNVTRLRAAAEAGQFGPAIAIPAKAVGEPDWSLGNLSRERVDWIKQHPEVLNEPTIIIESPPGSEFLLRCTVDGQHRGTARLELGLPEIFAYIVPHDVEAAFRVTETWL